MTIYFFQKWLCDTNWGYDGAIFFKKIYKSLYFFSKKIFYFTYISDNKSQNLKKHQHYKPTVKNAHEKKFYQFRGVKPKV